MVLAVFQRPIIARVVTQAFIIEFKGYRALIMPLTTATLTQYDPRLDVLIKHEPIAWTIFWVVISKKKGWKQFEQRN
jgi:hypothetical protein